MEHIRYCKKCENYTLKQICPNCGENTIERIPPKYSPIDKMGNYRRKIKSEKLKEEGLL